MQYIVMEKLINRKINKSFEKTLLDAPVPNRKIKFLPSGKKSKTFKSKLIKLLPEPLKPIKYVSPKPKRKPKVKPKVIPKVIPKPRVKPKVIPKPRLRPSPKTIDKNV